MLSREATNSNFMVSELTQARTRSQNLSHSRRAH